MYCRKIYFYLIQKKNSLLAVALQQTGLLSQLQNDLQINSTAA